MKNRHRKLAIITPLFLSASMLSGSIYMAQNTQQESITHPGSEAIDFRTFVALTTNLESQREQNLMKVDDFLKKAAEPDVILLDTRSKAAYDKKHLAGAIHLNFSDFTEEKLSQLIPDKNTHILIYCNNNFKNDPVHFKRKAKPLALNIPTYINLVGYGYENVSELGNLLDINDSRLQFEGTEITPQSIDLAALMSRRWHQTGNFTKTDQVPQKMYTLFFKNAHCYLHQQGEEHEQFIGTLQVENNRLHLLGPDRQSRWEINMLSKHPQNWKKGLELITPDGERMYFTQYYGC